MPVYEYKCPLCKNQSEHIHSYSDISPIICRNLIDMEYCPGILIKEIRTPPNLAPQSVPTRRRYQYMKKR